MKKFKPNKLTTLMFCILECFSPFCVGAPIMVLLMGSNDKYGISEILSLFPLCLLMIVLFIVFFCIINLVTLPFTKHNVFLFKEHFSDGRIEVKYNSITKVEIDSGEIGGIWLGGSDPCCLDCYSGDELVMSVEHPSLLMCLLVCRRCKNAKFRYKRIKRLMFSWVAGLLVCVAVGLLVALL